jgi:hypothetical protein
LHDAVIAMSQSTGNGGQSIGTVAFEACKRAIDRYVRAGGFNVTWLSDRH